MINKKSIFPLSLSSKVALVIAEVLLLTVGISAYIGITIQEKRLISRTQNESFLLSQTIHNELERAMLSGRREQVQSFLVDLGQSDRIIEASVFDPTGKIIFSTQTSRLDSRINVDKSIFSGSPDRKLVIDTNGRLKSMTILTPIFNQTPCQKCHTSNNAVLGALYFKPSLDWIVQESNENRRLMFYSAGLTVLISVLVITLLTHLLVLKPITALEQTMSEVAKGDLSKRVTIPSEDEIGLLGQHFNTMIGQLETANKKLAAVHEAELLRAGKLASLGELAAGLVHEMKNPLSGISAATQVMSEQLDKSDPRREIMQEMINQVERLNKTLNDLLSFAKPRLPQLMPVNINEVVQNSVLFTKAQANQQKIQLIEKYHDKLPTLWLDSEQIKQVLLNLILNAFQAMPSGGKLMIETKNSSSKTVSILVKDNGKGISPENLEKIFVPFFTTRAKGTGLGLPVSKKIIEMHEGTLEAESQVGVGTIFTITLPVKSHKKG